MFGSSTHSMFESDTVTAPGTYFKEVPWQAASW